MQRTDLKTDQSKLKTSGNADGQKRYQEGIFPLYHQTYDKLAKASSILNDAKRSDDIRNSAALHGLDECKTSLGQLEGNSDGVYKYQDVVYRALIPSVKEQLQNVHSDFKSWQSQQIRSGNSLTLPEEWPENHLTERLKAEALLDSRRAEKAKVEARIEELKARENRTRKKEILPNGPMGNVSGSEGTTRNPHPWRMTSVDGQDVSFADGGIPFIDEEVSPYNGMPIFHYKKMAKQWKKDQGLMRDQLREEGLKMYKEQKDEKDAQPKMSFTPQKMLKRKLSTITKDDFPEWPEGAEPIHELNEQSDTETKPEKKHARVIS